MNTQWDENIRVGVPHLNEGHKLLIHIFNYLAAHQHDGVESEAISYVMDQLMGFASTHFPREEGYMLSINYPEYDSHKQMHKQFREKTGTLCIDVMNHKETAPEDLHNFLVNWIDEHLLGADRKIKTFLETAGQ